MTKLIMKISMVLAFLALSSCANLSGSLLKDPEVNIANFKLTNITAQAVSMDLILDVNNPNPIPLNLDSVDYSLNFSGEKVTAGTMDQGVKIPASGKGQVTVPLTFAYNSVGSLLSGIMNRNFKKDYELTGTAKVGIFSIPFTKKGEVNLTK